METMTRTRDAQCITLNPMQMPVFKYAAFSEYNFKRTMEARGVEITTTFMSDLSIAEWCQVNIPSETSAVNDTIERCMTEWITNVDYIIEFLFAVNAKSWEQYAMTEEKYAKFRTFTREQYEEFAKFWSEKYYEVLNRVYEHYEDNPEATERIWRALD